MLDALIALLALAAVMTLYGLLGRSGHHQDEDGVGADHEPQAEPPQPKIDAAA